jgi:cell division protein FtsL
LTSEEVKQLYQLQSEITNLEMKLEQKQSKEEELIAKIEISSKQI